MRPELHPACACFPAMSQEALTELAADIRQNGLLHPITLMPDGRVLDGRCRWDACEIAGVEPRTTTYDGDDPCGYVLSNNARRRNLTASQKALIIARLVKLQRGRPGEKSRSEINVYPIHNYSGTNGTLGRPLSRDAMAHQAGISSGLAAVGRVVIARAEPHIVEMVDAGRIAITTAAEAVRHATRETQLTWTSAEEVQREGRKVIQAYPSNKSDKAARAAAPPRPARIVIPYGRCKFPTAEEAGVPPAGASLAEHDAFFRQYGRVPLHPKAIKDLLDCDHRTSGLTVPILNLANPTHPDADEFFRMIDQMIAWVPQRDKDNGEQKDFARMARATLALLEKSLAGAISRLTSLQKTLDDRASARLQPASDTPVADAPESTAAPPQCGSP
jgi:ParB-like nuclease family protein